MKLDGRVLPVPSVQMRGVPFDPFKGTWDTRNKQFFNAAPLKDWAFMDFTGRPNMDANQ